MVRACEETGRAATPDEQELLARYSGWGAVPQIFEDREDWQELSQRLRELLDEDEYAAARAGVLNAHYTDPGLVRSLWDVMGEAGFDGGTVLEPGCGSGNFIGEAPQGTQMVGVELDPITARVAHLLYPDATVRSESFERTWIPEGTVAAAVGNVPFGAYRPFDRADNADNLAIHNYFINKSMRRVAPGAYGVFVTSTWTMDAKTETARRAISEHSDLIGGVRLPSKAFARSAGTDAMTDVLIFRKRAEGERADIKALDAWVPAGSFTGTLDGEDTTVRCSKYFAENPERVLGELRIVGPGLRPEPSLEVSGDVGEPLHSKVREVLGADVRAAALAGRGYEPALDAESSIMAAFTEAGLVEPRVEETAFIGQVRLNAEGVLQQRNAQRVWEELPRQGTSGSPKAERLALVSLKETVREAITVGRSAADLGPVLERLKTDYQAYVNDYGPINRFTVVSGRPAGQATVEKRLREMQREWAKMTFPELTRAEQKNQAPDEQTYNEWVLEASAPEADVRRQEHLSFLRRDPDFGKLLALEVFDEETGTAQPSGYFEAATFAGTPAPTRAENPADALAISLNEDREVNLGRIADLLSVNQEQAREQLRGLVFDDPSTGQLVSAVMYLSGDVREELASAENAAQSDQRFEENVSALRTVVPPWVGMEAMTIRPGVPFIDAATHQAFCEEVFGVSAQISRASGSDRRGWDVKTTSKTTISAAVRHRFGTDQANPTWLLGKLMNNQPVTLTKVTADDKRVPDPKATALAREKSQEITRAFIGWVGGNEQRRRGIEKSYNSMMNSWVAPDYTRLASGLRLDGLNPARVPHPYQREAVARMVHEPSVLLDHVVGAGKTGSMLMGAMEMRRAGVAAKPWMVVPNHLVDQITRESAQWYPNANVLTIPSGVSADQRRTYAAASAAGDWDLVICPQSVFAKVKVSPVRQRQWLREDIEELEEAKRGPGAESRFTVKAIEGEIARMKARLERIDANKDEGIIFEETGCDYLLVDEAHDFKNLRRFSEYQDLQCTGSDKASDLDYILRALRDMKTHQGGKAANGMPAVATFATGTPVANSLAEAWVMGHYLRPDLMERYGIPTVDEFGTMFTEAKDSVEVEPSGSGFRIVNRVSSFTNMEAMFRLMNAYTSSVSREDLPMKLPQVAEGKMVSSTRQASDHVAEFVTSLVQRAQSPSADDGLLKILGEARKVALDPRMMGLPADPDGGRARQVAEQILRINHDTQDRQYRDAQGEVSPVPGGLQLAFCDLGVPGGDGFNFYQALKDELVAGGMDADKVAFIHDYGDDAARGRLFAAARAGELSVLIGSTVRMGTGMNVQDRVTAIHHVDIPWRPADLEQREGRGLRQGNQNDSLEIRSYISEGTFDAYMWQVIARKARFLAQLKSGSGESTMENIGGLHMSAQEMVIAASGDSRVADWLGMQQQVQVLENLAAGEASQRAGVLFEATVAAQRAEGSSRRIEQINEIRHGEPRGEFELRIGGRQHTNRAEAGRGLTTALKSVAGSGDTNWYGIGAAGALVITARRSPVNAGLTLELGLEGVDGLSFEVRSKELLDGKTSATGLATRVWNLAAGLGAAERKAQRNLAAAETAQREVQDVLEDSQVFSRQSELEDLRLKRDLLGAELGIGETDEAEEAPPIEGEEFGRIFGSETVRRHQLRIGDIIEVTDSVSGIERGMYVKAEADNQSQLWLKPADQVNDPDVEAVQAGTVSFTFVSRSWAALSQWERYLASNSSAADRVIREDYDFRHLAAGQEVACWGQEAGTEHEPRLVLGEVTNLDFARRIVSVREAGAEHSTDVSLTALSSGASSIVVKGTNTADSTATDEPDSQRSFLLSRALPGDMLIRDVEGVGEAGTVKIPGFDRATVDPETRRCAPANSYMTPRVRASDLRVGRDLDAGEIEALFPEGLGRSVDDLREGDVIEGQELDRKQPLAGLVRIYERRPTDKTVKFSYAAADQQFPSEITEVTKRKGTNAGTITARRFGALSQAEKIRLSTGVSVTTVEALGPEAIGSFIGLSQYQAAGLPAAWRYGTLEAVETSGSGSVRLSIDADGAPEEITVHQRVVESKPVIVFDEGWPATGIDFRGIPEGPAHEVDAEASAAAPGRFTRWLTGYDVGQKYLDEIATQLASLPLRKATSAETEPGSGREITAETPEPGSETASEGAVSAGADENEVTTGLESIQETRTGPEATAEETTDMAPPPEETYVPPAETERVSEETDADESETEIANEMRVPVAESEPVATAEVKVGSRVQATGEDALTGGSVEVTGVVESISEDLEDRDGRLLVTDAAGVTHHVRSDSAQVEALPDTTSEVSAPMLVSVTQVRPGDVAIVAGRQWEVYGLSPLTHQLMQLTGRADGSPLVDRVNVPKTAIVEVEPYPAAQTLTATHQRAVMNVREGDVVEVEGQAYDVYAAVHGDHVMELQLTDGLTEPFLHREFDHRTISVQVPLCAEDRAGVCAKPCAIPVQDLERGHTIATNDGGVAVVNGIATRGDQVQIRYQMLSGDRALVPAALIKNRGDSVMAHAQHHEQIDVRKAKLLEAVRDVEVTALHSGVPMQPPSRGLNIG